MVYPLRGERPIQVGMPIGEACLQIVRGTRAARSLAIRIM
jgi:hypothetical protein